MVFIVLVLVKDADITFNLN